MNAAAQVRRLEMAREMMVEAVGRNRDDDWAISGAVGIINVVIESIEGSEPKTVEDYDDLIELLTARRDVLALGGTLA